MSKLSALAALPLLAAAAIAAPPPPANLPGRLKQPVDGYDMRHPYERWRLLVEARKGEATELLLAEPDAVEGFRPFGRPILRFEKHNDFGHFLTGEIRVYCADSDTWEIDRSSCHYRLRRAFVRHEASTYGAQNPVSEWTQAAFDETRLAAHFRVLGFGPDTDWWRADSHQMFAILPSPVPVLVENATIVRLNSIECPPFGEAVRSLESERIDWRLDFAGVGEDREIVYPRPHAIRTSYTVNIITAEGGLASITGDDRALYGRLGPMLETADRCEADRRDGRPRG